MGIAGNVEGELALSDNEASTLYGNLLLSIVPQVRGKIVVTIPVIDYSLIETELMKVSLPSFWEKDWKVLDPILEAMKKGDFSYFAGTYVATPEANDSAGGGKKLNPLELKKNGALSGGHAYYTKDFYVHTPPISVEKREDGTYVCTLDKNSYYIIYLEGVIEKRDYILENQSYLKDVIYIRCFVFDGGVLDLTYYSDSIENIVTDFKGDDWVSQKSYTEEIGKKFISGTGIEYKVVAIENNFDAGGGRTRTILETQDGKRWMISNLPNFDYDQRTGITYFNIYKYKSHPDYVEYNNI